MLESVDSYTDQLLEEYSEEKLEEVLSQSAGAFENENEHFLLRFVFLLSDYYATKILYMSTSGRTLIIVSTVINAPIERVWDLWTSPQHIMKWNNASDDWHTTKAENDLKVGGKFLSRMEAKDGSVGFDFSGEYVSVKKYNSIESLLGDGRIMEVIFFVNAAGTKVIESFEAEETNPIELQRNGWQAILNNFKNYAESTKIIIK